MMAFDAACSMREGGFSAGLAEDAAREVRARLGRPAAFAMAFCSSDYLPHLDGFCETLRVDGHIPDVIGCTASGFLAGADDAEAKPGFSLLAVAHDGPPPAIHRMGGDGTQAAHRPAAGGENGWIVLADPTSMDIEGWLADWGAPVVGGLASGGDSSDEIAVFHNGSICDGVAVPIGTSVRLVTVLSQGCRPIGEPLTVTRAEHNVIYALGSHPAYEALESAFETLSDAEKATARGNLFAGLAGTEYVEEFQPGDFLVRNILGADPSSGAVVIGGIPRIGQTLQYQLRDAGLAGSHLRTSLKRALAEWGRPSASVVFACTGRGRRFFGNGGHDAGAVQEVLGTHPGAGFFCNGEIGPVGAKSCVHSYSLACALLYPTETPS
jgi:small ligand-binding sensory domain FIST